MIQELIAQTAIPDDAAKVVDLATKKLKKRYDSLVERYDKDEATCMAWRQRQRLQAEREEQMCRVQSEVENAEEELHKKVEKEEKDVLDARQKWEVEVKKVKDEEAEINEYNRKLMNPEEPSLEALWPLLKPDQQMSDGL